MVFLHLCILLVNTFLSKFDPKENPLSLVEKKDAVHMVVVIVVVVVGGGGVCCDGGGSVGDITEVFNYIMTIFTTCTNHYL